MTLTIVSIFFVFFFLFSFVTFLSLCSISTVSSSFYLLLFCVLLPLFPGKAVLPSQYHLPHLLGICCLCQFFISHSFHLIGPFQPPPHHFFRLSFTPSSIFGSSTLLLTPIFFFPANLHFNHVVSLLVSSSLGHMCIVVILPVNGMFLCFGQWLVKRFGLTLFSIQ